MSTAFYNSVASVLFKPTTIPPVQEGDYFVPEFTDKHNYSTNGYWETNEEPSVFSDLIKGMRFKRAGGICSAGEVSLVAILPRVSRELVLIDHSYQSLAVMTFKVMLLKKLGVAGVKELFDDISEEGVKKVTALLEECASKMPSPLSQSLLYFSRYTKDALRREWHYASSKMLEYSAKKLDKIKLVHGDLQELSGYGKFDLLYTSNAHDHSGRNGKFSFSELVKLLNPGGHLILAGMSASDRSYNSIKTHFDLVQEKRGYRTQWFHMLYRLKDQQRVS